MAGTTPDGAVDITDRQQRILDFIKEQSTDGRSPSVVEIARHFGISTGNVDKHLAALERSGRLYRVPHARRGIRLTGAPNFDDCLEAIQEIRRIIHSSSTAETKLRDIATVISGDSLTSPAGGRNN